MPNGEAAATDIDDGAEAVQFDLTDDAAVAGAFETIGERFGKLGVLVENASVSSNLLVFVFWPSERV